ncbi:MAG TPA: hypothetical protein VFU07_08905 [Candidatus Lumbricidophila sp.]|nr:hypothetical protein [Candidatus Lumbricidophila sp.]
MTDQEQPLTRRQARALEREQEQATASLPIISPFGTPVVPVAAPPAAEPTTEVPEPAAEPTVNEVADTDVPDVSAIPDVASGSDVSAETPTESPARVDPFAVFGVQTLPEHTLTRRELRALLYQAAPQEPGTVGETNAASSEFGAEAAPETTGAVDAASAELITANDESQSAVDTFTALLSTPADTDPPEVSTFAPPAPVTEAAHHVAEAAHPLPAATEEPDFTGAHGASAHPDDLDDEIEETFDGLPAPVSALHQTGTAGIPMVPTGHWTEQLTAPEPDSASFDDLISTSSIGLGTTSNALILPSMPATPSLAGNVSPEVVVTGTLQVSRGTESHTDGRALDQLFERTEDVANTGVAPVAASKAVGTAAKTVAAVKSPKRDKASLPLVLGMVAGVLALAVVGVLIVGNVMHLF